MAKNGGRSVYLFSEEETITNSDAIDALFIAHDLLIDKSDYVSFDRWVAECLIRSGYTQELCERFVTEYVTCGCAVGIDEREGDEKFLELNPRNLNRDSFYLVPARQAGLRRRPG